MKKIMVAVAALLCSAAMLFAQTSVVKTTTSELIEDGAIDSLAFGTEDNDGLAFVQFNNSASRVNFGWGKWLADSFWLSIYDSLYNNNNRLSNEKAVDKSYATKDGINIDYTDQTNTYSVGGSRWNLDNIFALGLGFGNFGTQFVWRADWYLGQQATQIGNGDNVTNGTTTTTSTESYDTATGTKTVTKYDNIKNYDRNNYFTVNFDGAGAKDLGDAEFYVELKSIYFNWENTTAANDYSNITSVYGKETAKVNASVADIQNTFTPGLTFELGFNLPTDYDFVQPKLVFEDSFSMSFKANNQSKKYTNIADILNSTTTTVDEYAINTGDYLYLGNTLTPKFVFDFDISEELTLTAQVSAGIYVGNTKNNVNTYKKVHTVTTLDKTTGDKSINKKTITGRVGGQNTNTLTTKVTPNYDLGLVYQIKPGKCNLNFGVTVSRAPYQWQIKTTTNPNINTVTTTENTDKLGNKSGSKNVDVQTGSTESKSVVYNAPNGTSTSFRIGGTWFFTENVKLDAYYGNSFTNLVNASNSFGIDLCVLF